MPLLAGLCVYPCWPGEEAAGPVDDGGAELPAGGPLGGPDGGGDDGGGVEGGVL